MGARLTAGWVLAENTTCRDTRPKAGSHSCSQPVHHLHSAEGKQRLREGAQ